MPKNPNVKRVMVIGSGPIVIGQAAEFDYAGTQACRSLKEEGVEVVYLPRTPEIRTSQIKHDLYDANSVDGESRTSHEEIDTDPDEINRSCTEKA